MVFVVFEFVQFQYVVIEVGFDWFGYVIDFYCEQCVFEWFDYCIMFDLVQIIVGVFGVWIFGVGIGQCGEIGIWCFGFGGNVCCFFFGGFEFGWVVVVGGDQDV